MELLLALIATTSFFVLGKSQRNKKDTVKSGKQLLKIKLRIKLPVFLAAVKSILQRREIFISQV